MDDHSLCPECGATYSKLGGGHCRGGAYGGCCRTFRTDGAAEAHRKGPHDPPGLRHCITVEEMAGTRWRETDRGWTNSKPMPDMVKKRSGGGDTAPVPILGTELPNPPETAGKGRWRKFLGAL